MDRPKPRWVPYRLFALWPKRWFKTLLVVIVFALLGVLFWLTSDRKDAAYWSGYAHAENWVNTGGYKANEASIAHYCQTHGGWRPKTWKSGCIDGAHNAMQAAGG